MEEKKVKEPHPTKGTKMPRIHLDKPAVQEMKKEMAEFNSEVVSILGRPDTYTEELGNLVCLLVATHGLSLDDICAKYKDKGIPSSVTVFAWMHRNPIFLKNYLLAKQLQSHILIEQTIDIADDSANDYVEGEYGPRVNGEHIQRSRERIKARQWVAARLCPKIFGDGGRVDEAAKEDTLLDLRDQIDALLAKHRKEY
jgi:hypothetical protein